MIKVVDSHDWSKASGFIKRISGPKIWNDLPYDVRASESLNSFKQKLKTHLF